MEHEVQTSQHPDTHHLTKTHIVLIGILLILAISTLFITKDFLLPATHQSAQTTASVISTPTPTVSWKTYTSDKYHFSFQYPSTGNLVETEIGISLSNSKTHPTYIMNINAIPNPQKLTTKQALDYDRQQILEFLDTAESKELDERTQKSIKPYKNGMIDGLSQQRFVEVGTPPDLYLVVQATDTYIYSFSIHDGNGSVNNDQLQIFDHILSTFTDGVSNQTYSIMNDLRGFTDKRIQWDEVVMGNVMISTNKEPISVKGLTVQGRLKGLSDTYNPYNFIDTKRLLNAGWMRYIYLSADRPGSSIWGYQFDEKDNTIRIVSLGYENHSLEFPPGGGAEIKCPCNYTFTMSLSEPVDIKN